jgi:type II secretory pathway pseudopilin PulG
VLLEHDAVVAAGETIETSSYKPVQVAEMSAVAWGIIDGICRGMIGRERSCSRVPIPIAIRWAMDSRVRLVSIAVVGVVAALAVTVLAQRGATPPTSNAQAQTTARIVASAQALLKALDDSGRTRLQFPFEGPQKTRWSNLPTGIFKREGLRMGDLTPTQRAAAMALLSGALSADGYRKVTEIIRGDEVLRTTQNSGAGRGVPNPGGGPPGGADAAGPAPGRGRGGGPLFGEDEYYLAFVGTPSTTAPWMLQFGGHHLAINLTMAGPQATMAPSLPAAQPATYTFEGRSVRPLGNENDKAFALINALDSKQRSAAILGYKVADLVLGAGQDGRTIQPEGIRASSLSAEQQTMLLGLAREWVGITTDAFAEPRMEEIKANLRDTYFAWSGPTTNGSAAYFRIQGPTLVIEYAPQNSVDHIHTIYRDPTNDYGAKFARK